MTSPDPDDLRRSPAWWALSQIEKISKELRRVRITSRTALLGLSIVAGWAASRFLYPGQLDWTAQQTLFLLVTALLLWITEALPGFAVGAGILATQVFFFAQPMFNPDPQPVDRYIHAWSNPIIWLMLGGFVLGEGLHSVGLDRALLVRVLRFSQGKPLRLLLAVSLSSAVLSMLISNTATTAVILAMLAPLLDRARDSEASANMKRYTRLLLLCIAAASSLGGMATLIGTAPNPLAVGQLALLGRNVSFLDWIIVGLPVSASALTLLLGTVALRGRVPKGLPELDSLLDTAQLTGPRHPQTWFTQGILALTLLLWMSEPWHRIPAATIALAPLFLLTAARVVTEAQVRRLPWDTLLLVSGSLSLGHAVTDTGLAHLFAQSLRLEGLPPFVAVLALSYLAGALSNFISNTAAAAILIPIGVALMPQHPEAAAISVALSSSSALLLPISTPPNALIASTGLLKAADYRRVGLPVGLGTPLLAAILASLFFLK